MMALKTDMDISEKICKETFADESGESIDMMGLVAREEATKSAEIITIVTARKESMDLQVGKDILTRACELDDRLNNKLG